MAERDNIDRLEPRDDFTPRLPVKDLDGHRPECSGSSSLADNNQYAALKATSTTAGLVDNATALPHGSPDASRYQDKPPEFVPPARPSSTPYPFADSRNVAHLCTSNPPSSPLGQNAAPFIVPALSSSLHTSRSLTHFSQLPTEVHEAILDQIFGYSISPTSIITAVAGSSTRSLGTALRHSRRRVMTDLALVSRLWRIIVQKRLYRHIKLKGTISSIDQAIVHFTDLERLASYVKHIEIWFPVFQPRYGPLALSNTLVLPTITPNGITSTTYILPSDNCTLADVFRFISIVLPGAKIMTLEGGERRKAPKVAHFHDRDPITHRHLAEIPSVQTLVTKGQWNLMRDNRDFTNIFSALPNLVEWRGAYSKPKSKSYISIAQFLPFLPPNIRSVSMALENDYRREPVVPAFYLKAALQTHICAVLGRLAPTLEQFAYTGRVCHRFFETAAASCSHMTTKLKSIDVAVKNCCRTPGALHETASGIQEMSFIEAFEWLVISAIRSLRRFEQLTYLRIRFVDIDSVAPQLNPYFLLQNGQCSGVWSEAILAEMAAARPEIAFPDLCEDFGSISYAKEGRLIVTPEYPRTGFTSLKIANYAAFSSTRMATQQQQQQQPVFHQQQQQYQQP